MQALLQILQPMSGALPTLLLALPLAAVASAVFFLLRRDRSAFLWALALVACLGVSLLCAVGFAFFVGASARHGGPQGMSFALAAKALMETVFDVKKISRPVSSPIAQVAYLIALLSHVLLAVVWLFHVVRRRGRQ
ncbi:MULTISPECIES: hypothetical protein [Acidovorax]|uniref:Transmembrane protein n=1 Tax=Acidovorax facilis TaxID=12917 RepID=A0ABV8DDQ0_9BURK|nr:MULTISPECIES: hypothetical protein [Acidovorax]KQB58283.1 hypothetical protein AE621_16410 [Acidovorax sp. SD340]MBO1008327.1 hypothetical protein [Acidovorax sp. SD340]MCO4242880.1 hypothetical protein [Acidovorax facilis]